MTRTMYNESSLPGGLASNFHWQSSLESRSVTSLSLEGFRVGRLPLLCNKRSEKTPRSGPVRVHPSLSQPRSSLPLSVTVLAVGD